MFCGGNKQTKFLSQWRHVLVFCQLRFCVGLILGNCVSAFLTSFWECKRLLEEKNLLVEKEGVVDEKGILKEVYSSKMFP